MTRNEKIEELKDKLGVLMVHFNVHGSDEDIETLKETTSFLDSLKDEEREELKWFSKNMEQKLKENDYKGGWDDVTVNFLLERLDCEFKELQNIINEFISDTGRSVEDGLLLPIYPQDIVRECADVANFAMMIADKFKKDNPDQFLAERGKK